MEEQQDSVQSANIRSTHQVEAHSLPRNILSYCTELEQWKIVLLVGRSLNNMSTRALEVRFDEVAELLLAHLCLRRGAARFDLHLP